MIGKQLLEMLVKENVIINSIVLNEDTNNIEYKTAIAVDRGIEIVTHYKNVFDLAFNECFALVGGQKYNLLLENTKYFYISDWGEPMTQPTHYAVSGKYALCSSAFKACEWFIENVNER